jgi:hypothetical protein
MRDTLKRPPSINVMPKPFRKPSAKSETGIKCSIKKLEVIHNKQIGIKKRRALLDLITNKYIVNIAN